MEHPSSSLVLLVLPSTIWIMWRFLSSVIGSNFIAMVCPSTGANGCSFSYYNKKVIVRSSFSHQIIKWIRKRCSPTEITQLHFPSPWWRPNLYTRLFLFLNFGCDPRSPILNAMFTDRLQHCSVLKEHRSLIVYFKLKSL